MSSADALDGPTLPEELRWLIRLRWVAGFTVVGGTLANALWMPWSGVHTRLLAVGVAVLAYNVPLWLLLRPGRSGPPDQIRRAVPERGTAGWPFRALKTEAVIQMLLDLVCLTLVSVWTGGMDSPLIWLFALHMVFASMLLPPLASYAGAAVAMALVFGGLYLTGQWPQGPASTRLALGWICLVLLTVYLTNHIMASLRRHQAQLARQRDHTQAILETAADGIITIDERGTMLSENPAAERIFGYGASEMVGHNVSMLMPEPDRSRHDEYIAAYLRTGVAKIIGIGREVEGRRRDGTVFPLELAVSEVRFDRRRSFTGIVRDVTERRRLNEALKRQQLALVQHEKMAAMGQMAAGIAHEIANPLASLDSLVQLVQRQPSRLNENTAEQLREQVERISGIVRQMTEFAHPDDSGWETASLNTVVGHALDMLRFDHRLRRVEVVRDLSAESGQTRLIPRAIQQIVVNLVMNAVDALDGVTEPRIEVRTRRDGDRCVIEVSDNGQGIPPEHLDRVFEAFFTTKPPGQGTGLGLSISYSLVERHGGEFEVTSAEGRGACFTIRLPAAPRGREEPGTGIPDSEKTAG